MPLTLAVLLATVLAHDEGSSSSEIRIAGKDVVWSVDVGTLGLQRVMDLGAAPHLLTREKLEPFRERIARYLERGRHDHRHPIGRGKRHPCGHAADRHEVRG